MTDLLRDYDVYTKEYTDLKNKQLQSKLSVRLEERQEGQQFRLIDPANLPVLPSGPPRVKICLGGLAGGLFLGVAFALLGDIKKRCFRLEKELSQAFRVPLVIGIPLLLTPVEERVQARTRALEWLLIAIMSAGVLAAEYYVYRANGIQS